MRNEEQPNYIQLSLKYGAFCGCALLAVMALAALSSGDGGTMYTVGFGPYMVISTFIYLCQRKIHGMFGDITFGRLVGAGLICGLGASVFVDLYTTIHIKIIDPGIVDKSLEASRAMMQQLGAYSDDQIQDALSISRASFPIMMIVSNTIIYTIVSLLFSLLGAVLNRKR